ncbi:tautomerase family protein [Caenimonas koreensis]|uniref:Tautomerase family protein n=1 Tax=Caenimonas koreensis DSM 17982 TaxID=1121255 RepID=A0A844B8F2_9BURK|nr:tautomerase family protein [Caenimonas koreensis]MRD49432.1 tautomerase family protein [Caenimonas koreensis DSM 17982]
MPLVRIELPPAVAPAAAAVSRAVHQAMVDTISVPADDIFQVVSRHAEGALVITPEYLGVRHSQQALMIQIFLAPGRTLQQKRALYARIAQDVAAAAQVSPADVIINLVETLRENWSFGDGIAQYTL